MNWKKDKYIIIGGGAAALVIIAILIYIFVIKGRTEHMRSNQEQGNYPPDGYYPQGDPGPSHPQPRRPPPPRPQQHPKPILKQPPSRPPPSPLPKGDVETPVGGDLPALVLFYSNGCGHCTHMKPDWETAKQTLLSTGQVDVLSFEHGEFASEIQKNGIEGFPTIRYYPSGYPSPQFIEYNGPRTVESLIRFAQSGGASK